MGWDRAHELMLKFHVWMHGRCPSSCYNEWNLSPADRRPVSGADDHPLSVHGRRSCITSWTLLSRFPWTTVSNAALTVQANTHQQTPTFWYHNVLSQCHTCMFSSEWTSEAIPKVLFSVYFSPHCSHLKNHVSSKLSRAFHSCGERGDCRQDSSLAWWYFYLGAVNHLLEVLISFCHL